MTEEKLIIATNTMNALNMARQDYDSLKLLLKNGYLGIHLVGHTGIKTFLNQEEFVHLKRILELRLEKVKELEKEFANL